MNILTLLPAEMKSCRCSRYSFKAFSRAKVKYKGTLLPSN